MRTREHQLLAVRVRPLGSCVRDGSSRAERQHRLRALPPWIYRDDVYQPPNVRAYRTLAAPGKARHSQLTQLPS